MTYINSPCFVLILNRITQQTVSPLNNSCALCRKRKDVIRKDSAGFECCLLDASFRSFWPDVWQTTSQMYTQSSSDLELL